METVVRKVVAESIREDLPYYGKGDIIDHLYNEGYTDYIVDIIGEDFSEEELPTSEIIACWHDIRDDIIAEEIDKIDWK